MLIDITLEITPQMAADAQGNEKKALSGHLGTHFDVMDKEFPLAYTRRPGVVFDVRGVRGRDIGPEDVELSRVEPGMFAAFCSGFITEVGYGGRTYFTAHPQLSPALLEALLDRGVSIIGVDFAGVRRGPEHTPMDQRCADRGVFVVENLWNLEQILEPVFTGVSSRLSGGNGPPLRCQVLQSAQDSGGLPPCGEPFLLENPATHACEYRFLTRSTDFTAHTYPLRYAGATGLPCRVVAEL